LAHTGFDLFEWLRPRKEVIGMDQVGALLGGFALLGIIVDMLLKKFGRTSSKFPQCRSCGRQMQTAGLPMFMPGAVVNHLDMHGLPTAAASRFICPNGHYQLWYVPRFGNTEKAFFLKEEL
jgi:hypothetical protein